MGMARSYVKREARVWFFMKLERTRASEARPARASPTCSSIAITFFWYEESSSAFLCWGKDVLVLVQFYTMGVKQRMVYCGVSYTLLFVVVAESK